MTLGTQAPLANQAAQIFTLSVRMRAAKAAFARVIRDFFVDQRVRVARGLERGGGFTIWRVFLRSLRVF